MLRSNTNMLTHQGMDGSPRDMRLTNTVTGIRKWEVVCRGRSHTVAWFVHCSKVLSIWRKKSYPTLFANRAVYPAAWWVCAHQQAAFSPGLSAQIGYPFRFTESSTATVAGTTTFDLLTWPTVVAFISRSWHSWARLPGCWQNASGELCALFLPFCSPLIDSSAWLGEAWARSPPVIKSSPSCPHLSFSLNYINCLTAKNWAGIFRFQLLVGKKYLPAPADL